MVNIDEEIQPVELAETAPPAPAPEPKVPDFTGKKVMVATPCYSGQCHALFTHSCIGLAHIAKELGVHLQFDFLINESLVQRGRNRLVADFLDTECTHLMFIDADIRFDPFDVFRILNLCEGERLVIGGSYSKKAIHWPRVLTAAKNGVADPEDLQCAATSACLNLSDDAKKDRKISLFEPVEVLDLPTGFMMIHRDVFLKMKDAMPSIEYTDDVGPDLRKMHAFFDCFIRDGRYLSEDYAFVRRWQDLGNKVYLCPWVSTTHFGSHGFVFDLPRLASKGISL